jgi:hypothetical protein
MAMLILRIAFAWRHALQWFLVFPHGGNVRLGLGSLAMRDNAGDADFQRAPFRGPFDVQLGEASLRRRSPKGWRSRSPITR